MVFLEHEGEIIFANRAARRELGVDDGNWQPCPVGQLLCQFAATEAGQAPAQSEELPFTAQLMRFDGSQCAIAGSCRPNTERREAVLVAWRQAETGIAPTNDNGAESDTDNGTESGAENSEESPELLLMEDVLSSLPEAVAILHDHRVLYINAAFTRLFGYTGEELVGREMRGLIVPETRHNEHQQICQDLERDTLAAIETLRLNKQGELMDVALLAAPLILRGERAGDIITYRDIGDRKQIEAKLQHDAMHDTLTALPNRALFLDRLGLALSRGLRRPQVCCAVLFIDLDHFKEINDSLGHAAGDELLCAVANRLRAALRPQDTAARLGGDEFAVLLENIASIADLELVAQRVLSELDRPYPIFGHAVAAGASIGVALAGNEYDSPELLIRDADFAMYRAKQQGGGRFEIFDKRLEVQVSSQQEREQELRQVLDHHQFELWYQPIYRLADGELEGFEALLRRRRTDGSVESFRDLLPVAEESGLAITLGRETLESACRQLYEWGQTPQLSQLSITVNLSLRQFYHPDVVAQIKRALAANAVAAERLVVEVSESTLSENPDAAVGILQRLIDCNLRVAVDNFGSGQTPLNHLLRLPIDVLKLDARLTAAASTQGRQRTVLEAIVRLGNSLGVHVVAQGIETTEQLNGLLSMGCEFGQGYLLSHVLEPARAERLAQLAFVPPTTILG